MEEKSNLHPNYVPTRNRVMLQCQLIIIFTHTWAATLKIWEPHYKARYYFNLFMLFAMKCDKMSLNKNDSSKKLPFYIAPFSTLLYVTLVQFNFEANMTSFFLCCWCFNIWWQCNCLYWIVDSWFSYLSLLISNAFVCVLWTTFDERSSKWKVVPVPVCIWHLTNCVVVIY